MASFSWHMRRGLRPALALSALVGGGALAAAEAAPERPAAAGLAGDYELAGVIGEGGYARVHAGRHRSSRAPVAIKRVAKARTTRAQFEREVAMLRRARGAPGVLALREAFETRDAFVLVTELVRGRELYEHLVAHGALSERAARELARQLARALAHLHARAVVHADVKPENILLAAGHESPAGELRLIDFGQAFHLDEPAAGGARRAYTLAYAAPEMLAPAARVGRAADVWALGVVLFVALCGRHPFDPSDDATDAQLQARIRQGCVARDCDAWRRLSPAARALIDQMLALDPAQRPSAEQVLAHPWILAQPPQEA